MGELDCKESWALKNWCFWTVVLEKTLESPLDCKEIQPFWRRIHFKGDQPWDFFGRNDAKAETPVLWPPHVKSWLIGKTLMLGGLGARGEGDDIGWEGWMASPTPGIHSDSCPSSQWCHLAISSSVIPVSSGPQSFPASEFFQWVNTSHEVAKVLEFQL